MEKILIIDEAGFIGPHLAKELVHFGNEVIMYDYRTDWPSANDIKMGFSVFKAMSETLRRSDERVSQK